jgi:transposase-like protein
METKKEKLKKMYLTQKMSMSEISKELGVATSTISRNLRKFGIETRNRGFDRTGAVLSQETKDKIAKARLGQKLTLEQRKARCRGKGWYENNGYVFVRCMGHPNERKGGYVKRANLVMENHLGRYLEDGELVHHKNHIRNDDTLENLELLNKGKHSSVTAKDRWASGELREILKNCHKATNNRR